MSKEESELKLIKGAFVKIIGGKSTGAYCEVQGFDEEAGRIILKTAINNKILNVNEILVQLVTKTEYTKFSKYLSKHLHLF